MISFARCRRLLCASLLSLTSLVANAEDEGPRTIRATVSVASGDIGGTHFGHVPDAAKTRRYYVAAESELWDFAPSGRDEVCGGALPPSVVRARKAGKLRYIQYTDETFATRVLPNRSLGIMGPALRGVVGEYLVVTFLNRTDQPLSMHPHGVRYDKDSEGAYYMPGSGRGSAVGPGARFTYVWQLDAASGPGPDEPSSKAWLYHSHVTGDDETNLGLIGPIIVTDPKRARADGTPADVDREFATLFMIFDESGLDEAAIEAAEYGGLPGLTSEAPPMTWAQLQQRREESARYAINGAVFGNLPGLEMNEGERTRWYLFALGSEQDFHTAHWHGLRVVEEGRRRTDVIELLPASMKVADIVADNPGIWLFHCHVAEHMREGMFARVVIHGREVVGVERDTEHAFLGHPLAAQSLRLDRAEALLNLAAKPTRAELVLEGAVTVFEGFTTFNETLRIQVGRRTVDLRPGQNGVAKDPQATLRVKNVNEFGVVHGGVLEFELVLNGAEWMNELERGPAPAPGSAAASPDSIVTLTMNLARERHIASRAVVRRMQR